MSPTQMKNYENVSDGRTNENPVETDKNVGENANGFPGFTYEQILTRGYRFDIIFEICALCPFPKALWNE